MRLALLLMTLFFTEILSAQVLVIRKASSEYEEFFQLIQREFSESYEVHDYLINQDTELEEFNKAVEKHKPDLLVLLDNRSVNLAKKMYDTYPKSRNIKAIASMGLNLQTELAGETNIAGVGYEASGYSIVTEYRKVIDAPLTKIVAFYRSSVFSEMIADATKQLSREQVELLAFDLDKVDEDDRDDYIAKKMSEVADKVDGIWVISDNILINKKNFAKLWIKQARSLDIPFLCGIKNFTQPKMDFCTFSASPLHEGLALHLVELGYAILEDDVSPDEIGVEYIVSLEKQLNKQRLDKLGFKLRRNPSLTSLTVLEK